jgi:hypothetical protein
MPSHEGILDNLDKGKNDTCRDRLDLKGPAIWNMGERLALIAVGVGWTALVVLAAGACRTAARGDHGSAASDTPKSPVENLDGKPPSGVGA